MITPTGATFAQVSTAIRQRKPQRIRITIDNTVLTDANIDIDGIGYHEVLNGSEDLVMGKCVCSSVDLALMNDTGDLSDLNFTGEMTVELGVEVGNTTVYCPLGVFIGERPSKVLSNVINFTANDRMVLFERDAGPFLNSLNYSQTIGSIFDALCTYVGVSGVRTQANANVSKVITSSPFDGVGVSCKDVLGWIAEACGCYARMSRTGVCELVWFSDHRNDYTFERTDYFDMDLAEFSVPVIDSVKIRVTENDVGASYPTTGTPSYIYEIIDSPYLYGTSGSAIQTDAQNLYTRLHAFASYKPLTLDAEANWFLQCGDIVTVRDSDGTTLIPFPIFSVDITYSGRASGTYANTGSEVREQVSETKRSFMRNNAKFHEIENTVDGLSSQITNLSNSTSTRFQQTENLISAEATRATAAEGTLSGRVTTNANNITLEVTRAKGAESTLTTNLSNEVTRATNAENSKYTIRSGIDITVNGVEISGSKWIKLLTDGIIYATSWQFSKNGLSYSDGEYSYAVKNTNTDFELAGLGMYSNGNIMMVPANKRVGALTILETEVNDHGTGKDMITILPLSTPNGAVLGTLNVPFKYGFLNEISNAGEILFSPYSGSKGNIRMGLYANQYVRLYPDATYSAVGGQSSWWTEVWGAWTYYQYLIQQSSRKLKKDIEVLPSCGEKLDALQPVTFKYKSDEQGKTRMGLIYEDTVEVLPEICTDGDTDEKKGINYVELIPMLLKEIQDLRKRVAELESKQ